MNALSKRSLNHIWNPCSQMKDYEETSLMIIESAQGSYVTLEDGRVLLDAISSWWCHSLGHGHPKLKQALKAQLEKFEHVIFANTTYEAVVHFSEVLTGMTQTLKHVNFASDGSCAIEMALKMSLHAHQIQGQTQRKKFMALENSYHGETGLALAVSDLGYFRAPYEAALVPQLFLRGLPYVRDQNDPLWADCSAYWPALEAQLNRHQEHLAAVIVEPIIQAAGGMKIYSQDFLKRLRQWTKQHGIHLIADEIMTGIGRTGLPFACQHAAIEPDFMCLSKGLTSGMIPLSVSLTTPAIYALFYDDYAKGKTFFHSHTHSGNALAVAVALACLRVMEEEQIYAKVQRQAPLLRQLMEDVADQTQQLKNIRHIGAMVAADLHNPQNIPRLGRKISLQALQEGLLLRSLGETLYWTPPLNISETDVVKLRDMTKAALKVC